MKDNQKEKTSARAEGDGISISKGFVLFAALMLVASAAIVVIATNDDNYSADVGSTFIKSTPMDGGGSYGLKYEISEVATSNSNGKVELTGYSTMGYSAPSGEIIIPATVSVDGGDLEGTYDVTSIKAGEAYVTDGVFKGCTGITEVTIPNSVKEISAYMFEGCTGLESVVIPSSVTAIGKNAFINCSNLESITIPSGVTTIEEASFYGCSSLGSIMIPNGVKTIKTNAFFNCTSLESITIPGNVEAIGNAFSGCTNIKVVVASENAPLTGAGLPATAKKIFFEGKEQLNVSISGDVVTIEVVGKTFSKTTVLDDADPQTEVASTIDADDASKVTFTIPTGVDYVYLSATFNSTGDDGDNTMLYIGVGVVAVIIILLGAVLLMRRR